MFDRVRELRRLRPRDPFAEVANDACMQTVPRTINTGLGALFILAALYILGGDTLTDFALALLIGILVGTWSSVFTATPLAVLFEGGRHATSPAPAPAPVLAPAASAPSPAPASTPQTLTAPPRGAPRPRKKKGGRRR